MRSFRRALAFLFYHAGRAADRAARLSHYLAVATLDRAEMRENIEHSWQDFYDIGAPLDAPLLPWEEEAADRFVPSGSHVLLVGCGSGRDVLGFLQRGCEVTGIDPAPSAIRIARQMILERQLRATLIEGFFEDATLAGPCEAVIFSYYCYAYIPESRRRIEALKKAAALLTPGGHILVSHASHTVRPRMFDIRLAQLIAALCGTDWRLEAGDVVWENRRARRAYSYCRAFAAGELEQEVAAADLVPVFRRDGDNTVMVALRPR